MARPRSYALRGGSAEECLELGCSFLLLSLKINARPFWIDSDVKLEPQDHLFWSESFEGVGWSRVWNHSSRVKAVLEPWLGKAWGLVAVTGTIGPNLTLGPFLISL